MATPIMDITQIVLVILLTLCISLSYGCPRDCTCADGDNQVSCIRTGLDRIPQTLPPNVITLDMRHNKVQSLTVSDLNSNSLRQIVNLRLAENEIESIHDGAFIHMAALQTLVLSGNKLSSATQQTFQGLQQLLHLDISKNQLVTIDGAFADMTELTRLDLGDNKIERITQFTFRDLINLRYLILSNNHITHIDRRSFNNLSKLMYLVLKGNSLHKVKQFQFNSLFLNYVDMSECGLTKLPRGLPNSIKYLQLRRNNMTSISRHTFQDCPYVTILVLDENGITEIEENTFQSMTLQQLWLNGNKLTEVPFPLPVSLKRLLMDQNKINTIENTFPQKSKMETLSFMGNNISRVEYDAFSNMENLQTIDLSNNKIEHIFPHTYTGLSKLKTLQLSKNQLKYFHSRCLHGLTSLKTLSMAYIETNVTIHPDSFDDLGELNKLDIDSSPGIVRTLLSSDALLGKLIHLEDLSMQSCDQTTLRLDLFDKFFPSLKTLHISSGRWHCDTSLVWFKTWLVTTSVEVTSPDEIVCFTPQDLQGTTLTEMTDFDFAPTTIPPYTTTTTTARLTTFAPTTPGPSTTTVKPQKDIPQVIPSTTSQKPTVQNSQEKSDKKSDENIDSYERDFLSDLEKYEDFDSFWDSGNRNLDESKEQAQSDTDSFSYNPSLPDNGADTRPQSDSSLSPDTGQSGNQNTTIIVIATTIVTVIIAAVLITTIIYFARKQRKKGGEECEKAANGEPAPYTNGIKYKHRNDVLYFMPGTGDPVDGSTNVDTMKSSGNGSVKEGMTLIPGRDINHEGPMRIYKWEEF